MAVPSKAPDLSQAISLKLPRPVTTTYPTIGIAIGIIIVLGGVFLTLAFHQIFPQGVNAISQLGMWGQVASYGGLGLGTLVILISAVKCHLNRMKAEFEESPPQPIRVVPYVPPTTPPPVTLDELAKVLSPIQSAGIPVVVHEKALLFKGVGDLGIITDTPFHTRQVAFVLERHSALVGQVTKCEKPLAELAHVIKADLPTDHIIGLCLVDNRQKTYAVEVLGSAQLELTTVDFHDEGVEVHPAWSKGAQIKRITLRIFLPGMFVQKPIDRSHQATLPDFHWVSLAFWGGTKDLLWPHPTFRKPI